MIVKKPIGAVKVEGKACPLTVGKPVPENVLKFWKKTKQIEELKKGGFIVESEEIKDKTKDKPKDKPNDVGLGGFAHGNNDKK